MKCRRATLAKIICNTSKFLLSYRTTEHGTTGQTPSQMLMNRRIRTKLDMLLPDYQGEAHTRELQQMEKLKEVPKYTPFSSVMVRSYYTPDKWVPGTVNKTLGNMHYEVQVDDRVITRHVDQLRPSVDRKDQNVEEITQPQNVEMPPVPQDLVSPSVPDRSIDDTNVQEPVLPFRRNRGIPPDRLNL